MRVGGLDMRLHILIPGLLAALLSAGCGTGQAGGSPGAARPSSYISSQDPAAHSVHLLLEAGQGSDNGGFNFDGRDTGHLTYTVPLGWQVRLTVRNAGGFPHSAVVSSSSRDIRPAFAGASTTDPLLGLAAGATQTVTFTASRAGRYYIACAVPGHAPEGMWIRFVVSASATRASVSN